MANFFLESKIFHQTCFSIRNFTQHPGDMFVSFDTLFFFFHLQAISSLPLPWFALKCDLTFTFFASVTQSNGPLRKTRPSFSGYKRSRL